MDIVKSLMLDHDYLNDRLKELNVLATSEDLSSNRKVAVGIVKDIRKRHRVHSRREVEILFPAMIEALIKLDVAPIDPFILHHLQEEHVTIGRNLYLLLQAVEVSSDEKPWITPLKKYEETLNAHIVMENERVFPQAFKVLPKEELERMNRAAEFVVDGSL